MEARAVEVVPVGEVDARAVETARTALADRFPIEVRTAAREPLPGAAYDDEREQYRAEELLYAAEDDRTLLAVTEADVFYRRDNYVFGLADVGGTGAVFSTYRLRRNVAGGAVDDAIVEGRVRKQAIKQVARLFGVETCDRNCVMRFAPTVRELDLTPETFCPDCHRTLGLPGEPGESDGNESRSEIENETDETGTTADPWADAPGGDSSGEDGPPEQAVAPTKEDIAAVERSGDSEADRKGLDEDVVDVTVSTARLVLLVGTFAGSFLVAGAGAFWLFEDVLGAQVEGVATYGVVALALVLAWVVTLNLREAGRMILEGSRR